MSLIKCYECGEPISKKAKACPHCGYPRSRIIRKAVIFGMFFMGALYALYGYQDIHLNESQKITIKNIARECIQQAELKPNDPNFEVTPDEAEKLQKCIENSIRNSPQFDSYSF